MASTGGVGPARDAGQCWAPGKRGWGLALAPLLLWACGGGAPLLHPAHTLPLNTVSFGAGVSGRFASDAAEERIDAGRLAAAQSFADPAVARTYSEGVLSEGLLAPGLSPWVAARVGLPWRAEAGLTYTGRSIRLDGRHVLPLGEAWALSLGVGASALFLSPDSSGPAADGTNAAGARELELQASGWGADVPIIIGYEAVNGFLDVWAGARAGFERLDGHVVARGTDPTASRIEAEGQHWWGGALGGFSLGVPPLWLRFELAVSSHRVTGQLTGEADPSGMPAPADFGSVEVRGWSLSPSAAILGKF